MCKNTICQACDFDKAVVFYDPRYRGFRGICPKCEGNWPES